MRRRDSQFASEIIYAIGQLGLPLPDAAKVEAYRACFYARNGYSHSEGMALKLANQKLKTVDVREAIAEFFEYRAGFTREEAAKLHVRHMRGFARKVYDVDRGVTKVIREKPNYQALKDYEFMVFEQAPKQVNVQSRNVNVHAMVRRDEAPRTVGRSLEELGSIPASPDVVLDSEVELADDGDGDVEDEVV